MTNKRTILQPDEEGAEATAVDHLAAPPVPIFRDRKYTSRTLILTGNRTAQVTAGKIVATSDELLALLNGLEDFERIAE